MPKALSELPEESGGQVTLNMCIEKINTSQMPIKLMKIEPVDSPAMMLNRPTKAR